MLSTVRRTWWGWAVLVLIMSLACAALSGGARGTVQAGEGGPPSALLPTQGDLPDGFDGRRDTRHFVLLWRQGETTRDEIDAAAQAESLFARLSAELGPARTPEARLILLARQNPPHAIRAIDGGCHSSITRWDFAISIIFGEPEVGVSSVRGHGGRERSG